MKTWNLTKNTAVSLGEFIKYRHFPNWVLPDDLLLKFVQENFPLVKSGMYTPTFKDEVYQAHWATGAIQLEYKPQAGKLLVNLKKSGKQHLYVLSIP